LSKESSRADLPVYRARKGQNKQIVKAGAEAWLAIHEMVTRAIHKAESFPSRPADIKKFTAACPGLSGRTALMI